MDTSLITKSLVKQSKAEAKRNEKFRKMSPDKQRVAVAKEILALVKPGSKIRVKRDNGYIDAKLSHKDHLVLKTAKCGAEADEIEWQQILPMFQSCNVCAIGIGALASIKVRNGAALMEFGSVLGDNSISFDQQACHRALRDLFTSTQMQHMEHFFEARSKAIGATKAIQVLWQSVIDNKGAYNEEEIEKAYIKACRQMRKNPDSDREMYY